VSISDGRQTGDVLDRATGALRDAPVPGGPPPWLVASTLRALQPPGAAPDAVRRRERRRIMFRIIRYGGLAAAAVLVGVAIAALALLDRAAGPAFADVLENVKKARSVSFTVLQQRTAASPPLESRWYFQGDAMRLEVLGTPEAADAPKPPLQVVIADLKEKKALRLDFVRKSYGWMTIDEEVAHQFANPIEQLRQLKDQDAERQGDEELDGRKVQVYRLKGLDLFMARGKVEEGESAKLWVDPRSGLPVRLALESSIPSGKGKAVVVLSSFTWNEPIAPEMFRMEVPEGFTTRQK
jgi:outer membrane lipoprotein-sorting protein